VRDAVGNHARFARPRACEHQQRTVLVQHRLQLLQVQRAEIHRVKVYPARRRHEVDSRSQCIDTNRAFRVKVFDLSYSIVGSSRNL